MKGSREPFHARMVPYFDSTDHHAFTPRQVGVPATSLTNWPDEYIHSTGDDLENIDATQLERNAVVTAAVALYFAALGDEELPALAGYVAARGRARVAADGATAAAHLARSAPAERAAAYRAAWNLLRQSVAKEQAALASLRRLAGRGRANELLQSASRRLEGVLAAELDALERAYTALTGQNVPNIDLAADERAMAEKVYVPLPDPAAFEDALAKMRRGGAPASHDALRGAELRRRPPQRLRGVRGGGGRGALGRRVVLRPRHAEGRAGAARFGRRRGGVHGPQALSAGVPYHGTRGGVSMRTSSTVGAAVLALSLVASGCGAKAPKGPTREVVTASLQQEANRLKADGEKLDPVLRVKATWTIEGLDVTERPNDPDNPWAGTIRFKIRSDTKDTDNKVETDEFEKRFDYLYTTTINGWVFQMPQ